MVSVEGMKISVIIPTLNEESYIEKTLRHVHSLPGTYEVIVSDGGSSDSTIEIVKNFPKVRLVNSEKGRAKQMNQGAKLAKGEVLLFLHADTLLPHNYFISIFDYLQNPENIGGSFSLKLDKEHKLLKLYTWLSRFSFEFFTYGIMGSLLKKMCLQKLVAIKEFLLWKM